MVKKSIKSDSKTTSKSKTTKKTVVKNKVLNPDLSYLEEDKVLNEVERYVDKKREKISKEISDRKSKRPVTKFQDADLEVMISRITIESKPNQKTKEVSKGVLYLIYVIILIAVLIFVVKYFFVGNIS